MQLIQPLLLLNIWTRTAVATENCLLESCQSSPTVLSSEHNEPKEQNVLSTPLTNCSSSPMTGYFRDGFCRTGPSDRGVHVVCATMTEEFLAYTKSKGNDLSTPAEQYGFPGLNPGDKWCLCAARWEEAVIDKVAPPVHLESTSSAATNVVSMDILSSHAATK